MDHAVMEGSDNLVAQPVRVGRRAFLTMVGLGAVGIVAGAAVQRRLGTVLGTGLGRLFPGGDNFQIYSITSTFPRIAPDRYRLEVTGLVERPLTLSLADLEAMPRTNLVKTFQCVTGWEVPDVHWEGVKLSDVLDAAGVKPEAVALSFDSYDGADTESLTLDQARLPDVIVAYRMLGGPITTEHGGPVRLYVAPMFGYKSLKWLSAIRVVDKVEPGFWEQSGYPVNGWIDGSTGPTDTASD
jgi:DMSO/TMAO reductase YedYZ molybdopterin-dependent catalytic subunit